MSQPSHTPIAPNDARSWRTDTLADSVLILLALSVVQRLVGFCRALLFCRWLDAEQLGRWDMAFSFVLLAAPLSVLALSAVFPRYVEYYRQRQQLRAFFRRTTVCYAACAVVSVTVIWLFRAWFSQLIFGMPAHHDLVALLSGCLLGVIGYHFFLDLSTSLRNIRMAAGLQFFQSLAFAVLGISLLCGWQCSAASVVAAYGGACALVCVGATCWLLKGWRVLPEDGPAPSRRDLWAKLLPFAAWIWFASLLGNLFEIADRYMILHFSQLPPARALEQVGEYHTSRVVPILLASVAMMLGSVLTPHLSHDWEQGRRHRVVARLNLFVKLTCFALSAAGVLVLAVAPLLFEVAFRGKFSTGLAILPWTLTYCIWFGTLAILQTYLWCAEKARLASIALLIGLATNVGLNLVLLPRLGLLGAVLATTAGNFVALLLIAWFNRLLGFHMDRGACALLLLPLVFPLGPWLAGAVLIAVALEAALADRLLSPDEKHQLVQAGLQYWQRFRSFRIRLKSARTGS